MYLASISIHLIFNSNICYNKTVQKDLSTVFLHKWNMLKDLCDFFQENTIIFIKKVMVLIKDLKKTSIAQKTTQKIYLMSKNI